MPSSLDSSQTKLNSHNHDTFAIKHFSRLAAVSAISWMLLSTTLTSSSSSGISLFCQAFAPSVQRHSPSVMTRFASTFDGTNEHMNNGNNDDGDMDQIRRRLESLIRRNTFQESRQEQQSDKEKEKEPSARSAVATATEQKPSQHSSLPPLDPYLSEVGRVQAPKIKHMELPPPPLLTAIQRGYKVTELEYLNQMQHGDGSVADLQQLWSSERGADAALELERVDAMLASSSPKFEQAKTALKAMVQEHGFHFVEPIAKLAHVAAMEAQWDDALEYYQMVLFVKPWHFGALSGIVRAHAESRSTVLAQQWASQRLPKLRPDGSVTRRRRAWTQRAVLAAQDRFQQAEKEFVENYYGPPDSVWMDHVEMRHSNAYYDQEDEGDNASWQ